MRITYTEEDIRTLSTIYDAAIDPSVWNDVLERIAVQARADGIVLFAEDSTNSGLSVLAFNSLYSEEFISDYMANVQPLEADRFKEIAALPPQKIHLDSEFQTVSEADAMPGMKHINKHLGINSRGVTLLHNHGIWFDAFTSQYRMDRSEFTPWHRAKMDLFLPHIAKVIEMSRPFNLLKARYRAVLAALDFFHIGVFIIEPRGQVVVRNEEGERILDLADGIELSQDKRLTTGIPDQKRRLDQAIGQAISTARSEGRRANTLLAIYRPSGADSFLVEVCPIRDNRKEFDEDFRGAFVLVIDPTNSERISTAGMAKIYNLTPSEAEICQKLAQGNTSKDIAERRNVSMETVRTQIKSLFEKTGTRHRSQLVRLAMTVNLPIDDSKGTVR